MLATCTNIHVTISIQWVYTDLFVTSRVPQSSILSPTLSNIIVNDPANEIKNTLTKFASNTRLGSGWTCQKGELSYRESWTSWKSGLGRTAWISTKASAKSSTWVDITKKSRLESQLGSSLAKRDLAVLVDNKLTQVSVLLQQHRQIRSWAVSAGSLLVDTEPWCPTLLNNCQTTPGVPCPVLEPTFQERWRQSGEGPNKGDEDDERSR